MLTYIKCIISSYIYANNFGKEKYLFNFITIRCHHCASVIFNLPSFEVEKLEGHTILCGCCNHHSLLIGSESTNTMRTDFIQAIA
jgi:hypothetical protein